VFVLRIKTQFCTNRPLQGLLAVIASPPLLMRPTPPPTHAPWNDFPSVQKVCTQVEPARDQALRPVLAMDGWRLAMRACAT